MLAPEADRLRDAREVQQLLLLGERHHARRLHAQLGERVERRVELADAAVDQDQVGIELLALARVAVAAADDLAHRVEVVVRDGLDAVAPVALLEGLAVDEADLRGDRLAAAQVRDVEGLEAADRLVRAHDPREAARARDGVLHEPGGLGLPVVLGVVALPVAARLALVELLDRLDLVAQHRGALELEPRARGLHLLAHLAQHRAALRAEEADEAIDVGAVRVLADARRAGRRALVDGGEQAGPEARVARIAVDDLQLAGAVLEHALQQLHRVAQRPHRHERPVDARALEALVGGVAGDVHTREVVPHRDGEVREGLVVLQPVVVGRMDVLHEARLHQERLPLAFAGDEVEVLDELEHGLLARTEVGRGNEVARHAAGQHRRLADVEDRARGVLHEVHAGHVGKHARLAEETPQPLLAGLCVRIRIARAAVSTRTKPTRGALRRLGRGFWGLRIGLLGGHRGEI